MSPLKFKLLCFLAALSMATSFATSGHSQSRFDGWSSVVVAADWRDGAGKPISAFDNARRDLSSGFRKAGLPPELHQSLTLNPDMPDTASPSEVLRRIETTLSQSQKGCLVYFTSHGTPGMLVFGDARSLTPADLAIMLRRTCETKPTVLVLSACYSGSFVDALRAPNRMILTAARRDRTSFGCSEGDTYPWFDACMLESLPEADDFLHLASLARVCVARRESEAEVPNPSEPQLFVGAEMQFRLPTLRFNSP